MKKRQSVPRFLLALLVSIGSCSFHVFAPPPCLVGTSTEPTIADVVILLDVSTSMFGAGGKDVIDKAVEELHTRLGGFEHGRILLMAFQGRVGGGNFGDEAIGGWGLPVAIPETNRGATWIGYEFTYPVGEMTDLGSLWSTVDLACRAVRAHLFRDGTGTYIYETMADAADRLADYLDRVRESNSGLIPFAYLQRIILVTDTDENHSPAHDPQSQRAKERTSAVLGKLKEDIGDQFTIRRLFWGPNCAEDEVAKWLNDYNYQCIPRTGAEFLIVPFPTIVRSSMNPAIGGRQMKMAVSLCSNSALPEGKAVLSLDGAYLCRMGGAVGIPFHGDMDPQWINLGREGVQAGVAQTADATALAQIPLPSPASPGQFSQNTFYFDIEDEALRALVRDQFPDTAMSPRRIVAKLRLGFSPEGAGAGSKVDFTDKLITLYILYEPPAMSVSVRRDRGSLDTGALEVRLNEPALDRARSSGQAYIQVLCEDDEVVIQGVDSTGRVPVPILPDKPIELPVRVVRPAQIEAAERRIPITVDLPGLLRESTALRVGHVNILPTPEASPLVVDVQPCASGGLSLRCSALLWLSGPSAVSVAGALRQVPLAAGLLVSLQEEGTTVPCSPQGATWNLPFTVSYPGGVESLRQLNQSDVGQDGVDCLLRFTAGSEDPDLFITAPKGFLGIDLRYSENRVKVTLDPGLLPPPPLEPGAVVASLVAQCTPDVPEDARDVAVTVDPKLLTIDATEGVQHAGEGRYTIRASPSPGQDKGRYDLRVAAAAWDCPVASGVQQTRVELRCLNGLVECDLPLEPESQVAFAVASRPTLKPAVAPDPQKYPARWQQLRRSGEIATVTYDLGAASSADVELGVIVRTGGGRLVENPYFAVTRDTEKKGTFNIISSGAPFGARGTLEFSAVDTACGLSVESPPTVEFSVETILPLLLWVVMLVFLGLSVGVVAAFVVYAKLESQTLFEALEYLWGFERWTVLVGAGAFAVAIAMMLAFLAIR